MQHYLITQRAYAEGHEIAVHTWSHPHLATLTDQQIYAELSWGIYAIHAAIGQTPKLFRPPYGSINDNVRRVAAQLGLTVPLLLFMLAKYRLFHGMLIQTIGKSASTPGITTTQSPQMSGNLKRRADL